MAVSPLPAVAPLCCGVCWGTLACTPACAPHLRCTLRRFGVSGNAHPLGADATQPGPRFEAALAYFGWRVEPEGWRTAVGMLRPSWDSEGTLFKAASHSWMRQLWADDPKTPGPPPEGLCPLFTAHRRWADTTDPHWRRVILACAPDARALSRSQPGAALACVCGCNVATRTHLTFSCPQQPWQLEARTEPEQRLLLPLAPLELAELDPLAHDPALEAVLRAQQREGYSRVLLALDGGCLNPSSAVFVARAAWAISSADGGFTCGACLVGPEHTSSYAERSALFHAVSAAHAAEVDVALLIDSEAVVRRLARCCQVIVPGTLQPFGTKSSRGGGAAQPSVGYHPTTNSRIGSLTLHSHLQPTVGTQMPVLIGQLPHCWRPAEANVTDCNGPTPLP